MSVVQDVREAGRLIEKHERPPYSIEADDERQRHQTDFLLQVRRTALMNPNAAHNAAPAKCAFISHSSPDDRYVAEFVQLVRSLGFDEVFNDSHTIAPDAKFWERIEQGIRECDAFVVILSQASVKSHWVNKEVEFARQNGKRVIPIRIDDCPLPLSFDGRNVIELKLSGKGQRISRPRFLHHAAELFLGRETELEMLDAAWAAGVNVLSLIAWGGVGKTSLMAEWVQTRFIDREWRDAEGRPNPLAYFDWSFYDQGTGSLEGGSSVRTGNVGDFFEQALKFFGDQNPSEPNKGCRLAELVRQQRTLFILDGLEPLQHPVGHARAGRLIDPDLRDFLVALAAVNPGLCVITSRQAVTDLHGLHGRAAESRDLDDLPKAVAVRLLRTMQVAGTDQELEEASEKFGCHALSLTLLGRFLVDAHGGDIRRIDRVRDLHYADDLTREDRHRTVKKVLATYEEWLATAQADGNPRTLAVLRLTGLFDRTATADCLSALRDEPVIPGLTDAICSMADDEWNVLLKRLDRIHLINLRPTPSGEFGIDAHPLVREFFAHKLKETAPGAWQLAHARLFRHLCENTKEGDQPTLENIQPLYQAIAHGCQAGRFEDAGLKVLRWRLHRSELGDDNLPLRHLGGLASELSAISWFFEAHWDKPAKQLSLQAKSWLLNYAQFCLHAMGRMQEAVQALEACVELQSANSHLAGEFVCRSNLSFLRLDCGRIEDAIQIARMSLSCHEHKASLTDKICLRTTLGAALHAAGRTSEALQTFHAAQSLMEFLPYRLLYSEPGFAFWECLLASCEVTAWRCQTGDNLLNAAPNLLIHQDTCELVARLSQASLHWVNLAAKSNLELSYVYLSAAKTKLYRLVLGDSEMLLSDSLESCERALEYLRIVGFCDKVIRALLTRAWLRSLASAWTGPESAQSDLDESWEIAERGPMPLFMADIHLYRARLFFREKIYPWKSPQSDLAAAEKLIHACGYHRRDQELADAKLAILGEVT